MDGPSQGYSRTCSYPGEILSSDKQVNSPGRFGPAVISYLRELGLVGKKNWNCGGKGLVKEDRGRFRGLVLWYDTR